MDSLGRNTYVNAYIQLHNTHTLAHAHAHTHTHARTHTGIFVGDYPVLKFLGEFDFNLKSRKLVSFLLFFFFGTIRS